MVSVLNTSNYVNNVVPLFSMELFWLQIPKLLMHRLFPNARFSLWIDGKLELVVDPYQVLERYAKPSI